jgi:sugar (pentulose or hexulose) kinase
MHYGFLPDTYVMLPVAESGGVSLEWFRRNCMETVDYKQMDAVIKERNATQLLFLPYLVGTNAPEFDADVSGVFWGLRQEHDSYDMARAVMEGVSFVLRKNCDHIGQKGLQLSGIIATGGGAKSPVWMQMFADIYSTEIENTNIDQEAATLGAAALALKGVGLWKDYAPLDHIHHTQMVYSPTEASKKYDEEVYPRFEKLTELLAQL